MLFQMVKSIRLNHILASLIGLIAASSKYFTTLIRKFVTFIPGIFPSFINIQSLHFRHDLSQTTKFYGVLQPLMSLEAPISQHNNVGGKYKYNNNIFDLRM